MIMCFFLPESWSSSLKIKWTKMSSANQCLLCHKQQTPCWRFLHLIGKTLTSGRTCWFVTMNTRVCHSPYSQPNESSSNLQSYCFKIRFIITPQTMPRPSCMHFSSPRFMPHALPISSSLTWLH
jgi:hypothetical protein